MPPTAARTTTLLANLTSVANRVAAATSKRTSTPLATTDQATAPVRLVAVSKLKPASDILALHNAPTPHLHFGENYLQELQEKSRLLPSTIRWHFIGGLQSNKCVTLARDVRGLWAVESVDSEKKASLLNKGWGERSSELRELDHHPDCDLLLHQQRGGDGANDEKKKKLRVFVQVNTSGEESKSGVEPVEEVVALCRFIHDKCPNLKLQGLMTIGAIARSKATTEENENEDFVTLREARDRVSQALGLEEKLELSMGMSEDFEGAIVMGSDEVRVGTTIFGNRPPRDQAKVV